jgi:hypothetical protein
MIGGMRLGSLVSMVLSVEMMAVCNMRVVSRFMMVTGRIRFGRLFMMMSSLGRMLSCVFVVFLAFLAHRRESFYFSHKPRGVCQTKLTPVPA